MLQNILIVVLLVTTPVMVVGQDAQRRPQSHETHVLSDPVETLPESAIPTRQIEALTIANLEGMAFQNNPTLAAAAARMEVAHGRQVQAGLYPNPVVGYHATEIGNLGTAGQQGGFIRQRFITAGKLGLDRRLPGRKSTKLISEFMHRRNVC